MQTVVVIYLAKNLHFKDKVLISDKHLKGVACANSQRSTNSHALESFI